MGAMLNKTQHIYTVEWTPPSQDDIFQKVSDITLLPVPINGKILIPFSKIQQRRNFILQNHHKVILIQDSTEMQQMACQYFRGIPLINEYDLIKNPQICTTLQFNNRNCPIPLVLQKFHQSYVKNYMNAFQFYGIDVWCFNRIDNYLRSECCNPYLICSSFELELLAVKIEYFRKKSENPHKLTILCFCNKMQYSVPKKTEFILQNFAIELILFQNILEIVQKINNQNLLIPKGLQVKTQKILFFLNEKEKQMDYLLKMAKRIEKSIRNVKVLKVLNKSALLQKIQSSAYNILIMSNDSKQMRNYLELHESLQQQGLEDRIIILRRSNEVGEKLIHRIQNLVLKPKHLRVNIQQKFLIFYGTLEYFKYVLKTFPKLSFKKFVDSTKDKDEINKYIKVKTEVVLTNLKLCSCNKEFVGLIECQVIYIRYKSNTLRGTERLDLSKACPLERWFIDEQQIIDYYNKQEQDKILYSLNFNYSCKKMSYIGQMISEIFIKLKEKKTVMYNTLTNSIFLFSCQYYTLDQMSNYIIKYFTNKLLGNYQSEHIFFRLKYLLYEQLILLRKVKGIQEQVLIEIQKDLSQNVFELSKNISQLMMKFPIFFEEVNSIWSLFMHQDRAQYLNNCQITLFLLILAFNKTNFVKYRNQNLQNLSLVVKSSTVCYDPEGLTVFTQKNRNNFVYNIQFIVCEQFQQGQILGQNQIIIKLDGNELTNFNLYMPLWKKDHLFLIPPLTKFQINTKTDRQYLLKLSLNSQHKLLQKFTQQFLQQNSPQLKLFQSQRQMRKFDVFLESMCHSKYQTAGYILKKLMKEETILNIDLLNAYGILYHLKKNEIQIAQQKLQKQNKYYQLLNRVVTSFKDGQIKDTQKGFGQPIVQSNKRIEENNKQYQNIQESDANTEYAQHSAMISTDPQMIRKLTSQYNLINYRVEKGRSPSYVLKSLNAQNNRKNKTNHIPIHNKRQRIEPSISLTDAISDISRDDGQMKIMIIPPSKSGSNSEEEKFDNKYLAEDTFGNKFMGSAKQFAVQRNSDLMKIKSTKTQYRSDSSQKYFQFQDQINESIDEIPPILNKKSTSYRQSNFLQMQIEKGVKNIVETNEDVRNNTANFNFLIQKTKNKEQEQESEQILEQIADTIGMAPVEEVESQKLSQQSEQSTGKFSNTDLDFFKFSMVSQGSKLFPIKRKTNHRLPKNSLSQQSNILSILQPKLINIEQESSSQISVSNNLIRSSTDKQNKNCNSDRTKNKKLFTFCRNDEKTNNLSGSQVSLCFNAKPHNLALTSEADKIKQKPLFYVFDDQQNNCLTQMNSISSIQVDDAEQIHPQQLIEQPYFRK